MPRVTKRELSKTAELSVFKWVFFSDPHLCHKSEVVTEKMLSKEQTADMGYLRGVLGVALRDKVFMFGFRKARCQAKFLTSHHLRIHRLIFYIANTLIKLIIRA